MKQATLLAIGLLTTIMFLALACGGDGATGTPRPRVTNTPVVGSDSASDADTPQTAPRSPEVDPALLAPDAPRVKLEISAEGDELVFDTEGFAVDAGSVVTLTYDNDSTLFQHNWVLVLDGAKDDVSERGTAHPTDGWVQPDDPDVIAATELLDPGVVGGVTFITPPPGTYQFVCTFPGHNVTMFGSFEVSG